MVSVVAVTLVAESKSLEEANVGDQQTSDRRIPVLFTVT